MNYATKTACVIAFVIAAFLFLAMGGGMWTGTVTGYGSMGSYGMTGEGSIGGVWLLAPLLVVLGAAFLWAAFEDDVSESQGVATSNRDS